MKRIHVNLLVIIFSALCLAACKPKKGTTAGKYQLGMLIETPEKLAGIPLASTPAGGTELPESIDLSDKLPPVGNQGMQQSCVAWAVAYALKSYQEKIESGQQSRFSPSFIYNQINNGQNAPTYVTDALNVLSQQGVCPYDEMPYDPNDWVTKPSDQSKNDAKKFRIDYWRKINHTDIKEVKAHLAAGYPVVIGANVSSEFIRNGKDIWKDVGTPEGGHCMLLVGYDNSKNAFKVMNSWGTEWGDNGFGWIDYNLFTNPQVIMYGFVTKDAITEMDNTVNTQPNNNNNNNNNNPSQITDKEQDYFERPKDDPTQYEDLDFKATNVQHNVTIPEEPNLRYVMKIDGVLDIPANYGKKFQVAVHVYDVNTNRQVGSLMYPRFSDVNGYASGYTEQYDIGPDGWHGTWWVMIPYDAVNTPPGRAYLYAIPTLFVDNFGVSFGDKIYFYLTK
jgi:hypothetical protein